jgi:hypothetical protein
MMDVIPLYHEETGPVFEAPDIFVPVTGEAMRPDLLFLPREVD